MQLSVKPGLFDQSCCTQLCYSEPNDFNLRISMKYLSTSIISLSSSNHGINFSSFCFLLINSFIWTEINLSFLRHHFLYISYHLNDFLCRSLKHKLICLLLEQLLYMFLFWLSLFVYILIGWIMWIKCWYTSIFWAIDTEVMSAFC